TGAYLVLKDPYAASDPSDSSSWRLSHSADLPPFGTAPDPDAGYLTWVESAIPDPEMRVPTADPDGDGWSNLFEYLFNSEPTHSNSTPSISISGHLEEDRVIANYAIPFRPGVSGHEITVESSPDMVEWLPLTEDSIVE